MILGVLRTSRRDALVRALHNWRSAAFRRVRDVKRLQSVGVRALERQRMFLLRKGWSKLVRCAGEREASRARKVGCEARVMVGAVLVRPRGEAEE